VRVRARAMRVRMQTQPADTAVTTTSVDTGDMNVDFGNIGGDGLVHIGA
jgi:hypothetical protein